MEWAGGVFYDTGDFLVGKPALGLAGLLNIAKKKNYGSVIQGVPMA